MYCNVFNFLDESSIIFNRQFGFCQKHPTSHAIITLIHKITYSFVHGDIVISIFLDLKKPLDNVDHRILLNKLYAYGIRGNIHDWFRSYLTDRSQFVIYDGERSDTKICQWKVIIPGDFNIYIFFILVVLHTNVLWIFLKHLILYNILTSQHITMVIYLII